MPDRPHLREHKPRYGRVINQYEKRRKFLIVCEGKKTEPKYFQRFRSPSLVINIEHINENTIQLVDETIRLKKEMAAERFDQVWCVFDRDSFPAQDFNAAIDRAKRNNIFVAYSNEAFELWYVLHFQYLNTGISRIEYIKCLEKHLGHPYKKNCETIYQEILHCQDNAIRNAHNLLQEYRPSNPANDNPSTTVHLLVEQLNQRFWK